MIYYGMNSADRYMMHCFGVWNVLYFASISNKTQKADTRLISFQAAINNH